MDMQDGTAHTATEQSAHNLLKQVLLLSKISSHLVIMVCMQLVQKPTPDPDQAAADSSWAGMADANPMADATGLASGPSSSDAANAMEGVVMNESHSKEGGSKADAAANEKASFEFEFKFVSCSLPNMNAIWVGWTIRT